MNPFEFTEQYEAYGEEDVSSVEVENSVEVVDE